MGVKPTEFWELTLKEFTLLERGEVMKQDRSLHLLAWHAANLMNRIPFVKGKVTIRKLLGNKDQDMKDIRTVNLDRLQKEAERRRFWGRVTP